MTTLQWCADELLSASQRQQFLGRGAPFELASEVVCGAKVDGFVRRPRQLGTLLYEAAARFDARPYLTVDDDVTATITFAEMPARVAQVADVLARDYGIRRGDRCAIAAANCLEYVVIEWAVLALGAIVTNLNGWWTPSELAYGIHLTQPALIVGDARRVERLRDAGSGASVPIVEGVTLLAASEHSPVTALPVVELDEDEAALILFTSGTTGRPKGATLTHRNVAHAGLAGLLGRSVTAMLGQRPPVAGGVQVCSLPFFHVSGAATMLHAGPLAGTTLVLGPTGRFDPATYLATTAKYGLASWSGVATQLWRVLDHPDFDRTDLSSVRNVTCGGGPFPPELMRQLRAKLPGVNLTNGYGATEITGGATSVSGSTLEEHPGTVGRPHPTIEVQVRDADGSVLDDALVGEICVRGATVFRGYWDDAAATAAAFFPDRWYRTGDFGRIVDGLLYVESRRSDLIIRGGENIYPAEIEHRLLEHPDIAGAAVVGLADRELGQVPVAHVVVRAGVALRASDVQDWVAGALAPFKVPVRVEFRAALPATETGKVKKHELGQESEVRRWTSA